MSYLDPALPPITITTTDLEQLTRLADSGRSRFPYAAELLTRELTRAEVVAPQQTLRGLVHMGSRVSYRDDECGRVREVILVFPHEANIDENRVSVLTPVGAALIGLSVGQTIAFETPHGQTRTLTVLSVSDR